MKTTALDWFVRNLDLQLEDVLLEENGIVPTLYLDTADVRAAILGLDTYVDDDEVDLELFNAADRPLVAALADIGWLGKFYMLQPHQDEFLGLLKSSFYLPDNAEPNFKNRAKKFLAALDLPLLEDSGISSERDMDLSQAEALVRLQAGSADIFFKALHCIRGNWRTRLDRWFKEEIFDIARDSKDRISYTQIVASPEFMLARDNFENARPGLSASNFADAVAMCILSNKVDQFRVQRQSIPRFFVSTNLFEKVAAQSEFMPKLMYHLPDGKNGIIFRNYEYFVFKATFRPPSGLAKSNTLTELRELRQRIRLAQEENKAHADILNDLRYDGKPLGVLIKELQSFYFLENVWLPAAAKSYVEKVHNDFVKAAYVLGKDATFQRAITHVVQTAKETLSENVEEYRAVKRLLSVLEAAPTQMPTRREQDQGRIDPFRAFGLLRFGFPLEARHEIADVITGFYSQVEGFRKDTIIRIIRAFHDKISDEPTSVARLCAASAMLWILRDYRILIQRLTPAIRNMHASLKGLFAACAFDGKIDREIANARVVVNELQKECDTSKDATTAVILAYLYHHDWVYSGYVPVYSPDRINPEQSEHEKNLISLALKNAQLASENHPDEATRVYAINQYLYYWSEAVPGAPLQFELKMFEALVRYKANPSVWQYRFDNTLAHFYYRMALSAQKDRMVLLRDARKHSDWAVRDAPDDSWVEQFNTLLSSIEARWIIEGE
jgi:hypothetical protein